MLALEMNKDPILKRFLELCHLDHQIKNVESIKTKLQDFEEESTPDAVFYIDGKEKILFIECKLNASIGTNQLIKHVRSGKGNVPMVCISRGKVEPKEIKEAQENLLKEGFGQTLIRWIGWQQIYTELVNLPHEIQEKPEVRGLIISLEKENLAARAFTGFKKDELVSSSQLLMRYSSIFENVKQLIHDIIEHIKEKDNTIEANVVPSSKVLNSIYGVISGSFRHTDMMNTRALLEFDFYEEHVRLAWDNLQAKHLKIVNESQLESYLIDLKKRNFRFEILKQGKWEESETMADLKKVEDEDWVAFSSYYSFDNEIFYVNPPDVVKHFADEVVWMLHFFKTRGL
jgi:hypothetical protein